MTEPIVKEIFIDAPPEDVFPFLTESDKYLMWMGVAAELDAKPGGLFKVDPNGKEIIEGRFVEVSPPRRVVFTWGWREPKHQPMRAGSSRVEIDLAAVRGGTLLTLRHFDVIDSIRPKHEEGWRYHLERLQKAAAGLDPGVDTCIAYG
jgi:uncharacterized protein YndB with AHSA1/START domain